MTQTALYRHYDSDGRLLYVGISLSAVQRLAQHATSAWAADIRRVEVEMYQTREAAEIAEIAAVKNENPAHNSRLRLGTAPARSAEDREAVRRFVSKIGRDNITAALGRTPNVISNAVAAGQFPASWYAVMLELCAERGLLCPFELFAWEKRQDKKAAAA